VITRDHTGVIDQILVDNRQFFIHHLHSTPPVILIILSRLDRGIQAATERSLKGGGVFQIVATAHPRFPDDALVIIIITSSPPPPPPQDIVLVHVSNFVP